MMQSRLPATITLLCLLFGSIGHAVAADPHKNKSGRSSFSDAEYWAERWEGEERDEWQLPVVLTGLLGVQAGDVVADLGAGTGYLTRPLAMLVGDEGAVYVVDVEQSMLDYIRGREDILRNRLRPVLADPDDPKLPDGAIDLVLTVNTWHHIAKRVAYLERLERCLAPDGRLVIVDFRAGELPVGPPQKQKISRDQVVREFEKAGWRLEAESIAFPYQYFLTFFPPREPGEIDLFTEGPSD